MKDIEFEKLKREGTTRLILVGLFLCFYEVIMYIIINTYIDESNTYKKYFSSIDAIMVGPAISIFLGWMVIGRKRLKALGWPFDKLFSAD